MVLLEWLGHVQNHNPTRTEMVAWALARHERARTEGFCDRCLQTLGTVGLVRFDAGVVQLTAAGSRLLRTRDRAFLLEHTLATTAGFEEVMELCRDAWRTADEALAGLQTRGFTWKRTTQVRNRLEWLLACGVAQRRNGRWRVVR